jgi:hypothetical protein
MEIFFMSLPIPGENSYVAQILVISISMNGKVHIGTSGWSYKDWIGIFYPKKMKPADWAFFLCKNI